MKEVAEQRARMCVRMTHLAVASWDDRLLVEYLACMYHPFKFYVDHGKPLLRAKNGSNCDTRSRERCNEATQEVTRTQVKLIRIQER